MTPVGGFGRTVTSVDGAGCGPFCVQDTGRHAASCYRMRIPCEIVIIIVTSDDKVSNKLTSIYIRLHSLRHNY